MGRWLGWIVAIIALGLLASWGVQQWRDRRGFQDSALRPSADSAAGQALAPAREKYLVMRQTYHVFRDLIHAYEQTYAAPYTALRYEFAPDGTVLRFDADTERMIIEGGTRRGQRRALALLERTMQISLDLLDHYEDRALSERRRGAAPLVVGGTTFGAADTALVVTEVRRYLPTQRNRVWNDEVYDRHVRERVQPLVELARTHGILVIHAWHGGGRYPLHPELHPQVGELRVGWRRDHERVQRLLESHGIQKLLYVGNNAKGALTGSVVGMQEMERQGRATYIVRDAILAPPPGPTGAPLPVTANSRRLLDEATARILRRQVAQGVGRQLSSADLFEGVATRIQPAVFRQ